ncbi:winged helix-turn-helix transcriptional regulator, partial [bacterium]|nr:winged helix-turn-helix transcriptional regulator [bacterium]
IKYMENSKTVEQIISLFFKTSRLIYKQFKIKDRHDFFSFLQLETLNYIKNNKKPLMKEVAGFLSITPSSATPLINRLAKIEMIKRCLDEDDRRAVRLSITPKGQKMLKKEIKKVSIQMQKTLARLNRKEQKNLIEILQKIQKVYSNNQ